MKALITVHIECPKCGYDYVLLTTPADKVTKDAVVVNCTGCDGELQVPLVLVNYKQAAPPADPPA